MGRGGARAVTATGTVDLPSFMHTIEPSTFVGIEFSSLKLVQRVCGT